MAIFNSYVSSPEGSYAGAAGVFYLFGEHLSHSDPRRHSSHLPNDAVEVPVDLGQTWSTKRPTNGFWRLSLLLCCYMLIRVTSIPVSSMKPRALLLSSRRPALSKICSWLTCIGKARKMHHVWPTICTIPSTST